MAKSSLPEDFPGKKQLKAAGVTSEAQLQGKTREELLEMEGIGPKTADEILARTSGGGSSDPAPAAEESEAETVKGKNGTVTTVIK